MAEGNGRIPLTWAVQAAGWLTAMLVAYGMARADIAGLQADQRNTEQRLQRIEQKVDVLLERR